MTVNAFITTGKEQQQITIGKGSTKDELQATGRWLSINADDAMEIKP